MADFSSFLAIRVDLSEVISFRPSCLARRTRLLYTEWRNLSSSARRRSYTEEAERDDMCASIQARIWSTDTVSLTSAPPPPPREGRPRTSPLPRPRMQSMRRKAIEAWRLRSAGLDPLAPPRGMAKEGSSMPAASRHRPAAYAASASL